MNGEKISESCKETINFINREFERTRIKKNKYEAEIKMLEERVKTAEELVVQIKTTANVEIQKAYKQGYNEALSKVNGTSNPEGGPKLVYSKN